MTKAKQAGRFSTSISLDERSKATLDQLAQSTNRSYSQVVRDLLADADGSVDEIVSELADLLKVKDRDRLNGLVRKLLASR